MAEFKLTDLLSTGNFQPIQPKDSIIVDILDLSDVAKYVKGPNPDAEYSNFTQAIALHAELMNCQILHVRLEAPVEFGKRYYDTLFFNPIEDAS